MIEKQEVQELFPTTIWMVDLRPPEAAVLNAMLKAEIEKIISPRPKVPAGSNWQTPQDLHTRPAFADFVKLVEMAARGVARHLQVDQYPMMITGCWANINPPGAYHPTHNHPNNYLSGVYYVAVPAAGSRIQFQDPRPMMVMPRPRQFTRITANAADAEVLMTVANDAGPTTSELWLAGFIPRERRTFQVLAPPEHPAASTLFDPASWYSTWGDDDTDRIL